MNASLRYALPSATHLLPRLAPRRLLIVTDAWHPQVNGVVRTLDMLAAELSRMSIEVSFLTPEPFKTVALPSYPEIRLAVASPAAVAKWIQALAPDAIHIATEGPLGVLAAAFCRKQRLAFTTCFHTRFPDYIAARLPIPKHWTYELLRRFHASASRTMVATQALSDELTSHGFRNLRIWQRGIDLEPFLAAQATSIDLPRPIHLYVGRIAKEKNLEAFLSLDLPGSKVLVGDGPCRSQLQARFPEAYFLGFRMGADLASIYAAADVFVFPSRTDTYGLVMLEALAAGTPVAAYPVAGPQEVIGGSGCGCLRQDLKEAIQRAMKIDRNKCRRYATGFTIRASALSFLSHLDLLPIR